MKKALLVLAPILLLVGIGVGLSAVGIVHVPFLPFGKKKGKPPVDDGKGGPLAPLVASMKGALDAGEADAKAKLAATKPPAPPPVPKDTSAGEAKLASLWAEMPTDRLVALLDRWPEAPLGRILAKMDGDAVTSLLAALPPPRAQALSQAIAAATDEAAQKVHTNGKI